MIDTEMSCPYPSSRNEFPPCCRKQSRVESLKSLASSEFVSTANSQGLTLPGKTGSQWTEQVGRIFLHNSEFL